MTADTDVGLRKNKNEDSILIKHAMSPGGEVVLAVICDGMGGLAKGELASATVIRAFDEWFHGRLPEELDAGGMEAIGKSWESMLIELNNRILNYGRRIGANLGTTFSGILMAGGRYVIGHVGDTRIYHLAEDIRQLTEDQTVVAREVKQGILTPEQARTDRRKNVLLQCVGASREVVPQILHGEVKKGVYMLCSDGFRNKITDSEIWEGLQPKKLSGHKEMHEAARGLIDQVKARKERDNISVALLKLV